MTEPALSAIGLGAVHVTRHGPVAALTDVSLTIAKGEALAIVGRSGCGKTTLARLLAGLPPRGARVTGRLAWPGGTAPVGSARRAGLGRRVAWLPQEAGAALNPMLRIGDQVAETLRAARSHAGARLVTTLLEETGLDPALAARYPHEVSGGQAQRAALACALAQEPTVMVADEPTSALDAATAAAILRLLRDRTRERGLALVLVTHDFAAAGMLCDRAVILQAGRVVEHIAASTLLAPRSVAGRELAHAARALRGADHCLTRAA